MLADQCESSLLFALPDDIFSVITRSLSPKDVCSLALSCRDLNCLVASDKVWFVQCDKLVIVPSTSLIEWRKGVSSYKALCRFLMNIHPMIGIWVHQNPELGNVVYVLPGFCSVVGCRIIPQEVGHLGIEDGPILWTPVFEILCDYEGTPAFFLHGRERGVDYVYPGLLKPIDRHCNVLLLEVETRHQRSGGKLAYSKSFAHEVVDKRLSRSGSRSSKSQRIAGERDTGMSFSRLGFGDRRRLLDFVTTQVRKLVPETANVLLFPRFSTDDVADLQREVGVLYERRLLLLQMYKRGGGSGSEMPLNPTELGSSDVCKSLDCCPSTSRAGDGDGEQSHCSRGKTLSGFLKNGFKQILGKSSSSKNGSQESQKKSASTSERGKYVQLHEYLRSGDTVGLALRSTTMKLSSYRAWPNMHDSRFALYKLPVRAPKASHEYAGLWGGTFGWPPGRPTEDKPGKALFLLLISYEEPEAGQQLLIATKILEGTSYVLHPNGSAMFIVNIAQPSMETFPLVSDEDVKQCFVGEGIANGYGFRYPGSKPGSLFVIENGLLVFVWKESRAVLTLQRLNLANLLRKGERVPCLSPISNFAYLTKTYSNVYSGFSNSSNGPSSPRVAFHDRSVILDPTGLGPALLHAWRRVRNADKEGRSNYENGLNNDMVRSTFVFGPTKVEQLKNLISTRSKMLFGSSIDQFLLSPNNVCCAFMWVCWTKLHCSISDCQNVHYFGYTAGGVSRVSYPVPDSYMGNCVGFGRASLAQGKLVGENGIVHAAKSIGDTVTKVNGDTMGGSENWISEWQVLRESELHIIVTGSPKLGLYGLDFGWGKPLKIEQVSIDATGAISVTETRGVLN